MINKYKIKITGKNTKRFVKELIKEKISLYYIDFNDKYTIIIVDDDGYKTINNKKTSYKINIIDEYGIVKIKDTTKKYSLFLICILCGIILIKILSNIVFDIDIEHSKSEIREMIMNDLEEYGIKKYHFKVSYKKKEKIIKKILKKETNNIEWLEIDNIGTKYIVKVEERIKNEIKQNNKCQNIVAKKDAMILSIMATNGEVKVAKNQYVKKGDVLISGFISKDDKIVKKERAQGEVFGEVWYQVEVMLPEVYKEETLTGKSKKRLELKFLNKEFFFFDFSKYKTYAIKRKKLLSSNILPISINYSTIRETRKIVKDYSIIDSNQEAIKLATKRLKNSLGKKDSIISKNVLKKSKKDSKIVVDIFFKVKEDITDTVNIDNIDITKQEGEKDESSN